MSPVPTAPVASATPRAFTAALRKVLAQYHIEGAKVSTKVLDFGGLGYGTGASALIELPKGATVSDAVLRDLEATRQAFRATAGGPCFDPAKEGKSSSFRVDLQLEYRTTPKDELFIRQAMQDQAAFNRGEITRESLLQPTTGGAVGSVNHLLIHWAAARGRLAEVPDGILSRDLLTVTDNKRSMPLHEAGRLGSLHKIPGLAELVEPSDLIKEDSNGYTPLQFALRSAYNGEIEAANLPEAFVRVALKIANDPKLTERYEELRACLQADTALPEENQSSDARIVR